MSYVHLCDMGSSCYVLHRPRLADSQRHVFFNPSFSSMASIATVRLSVHHRLEGGSSCDRKKLWTSQLQVIPSWSSAAREWHPEDLHITNYTAWENILFCSFYCLCLLVGFQRAAHKFPLVVLMETKLVNHLHIFYLHCIIVTWLCWKRKGISPSSLNRLCASSGQIWDCYDSIQHEK